MVFEYIYHEWELGLVEDKYEIQVFNDDSNSDDNSNKEKINISYQCHFHFKINIDIKNNNMVKKVL